MDTMKIFKIILLILMGSAACQGKVNSAFSQTRLEPAFPNLSFNRPVDFQHPGDGSNRLFVVEQQGIIRVFENSRGTSSKTTFLDITGRVDSHANEMGLLGLAFHPDFKSNGYFFVDYTAANPMRTVISRFSVNKSNPDKADPDSEFIILEIPQPFENHNGGQIVFGPDGFLYIAMGDGGSGGDPYGNGQNKASLLGKILRIDIDHHGLGAAYGIPADNPFAGNVNGFRQEIYAYGLRNPWRFSFDAVTGQLWAADVGQDRWEEADIIEKGGNYGWNIMEGKHCYASSNCDTTGLLLPEIEYDHSVGNAITGGFVYRGKLVPELYGSYIYGDYVSGRIWKSHHDPVTGQVNDLLMDTNLLITSFGIDADNEIYLCAFDGQIYRFISASTKVENKEPGLQPFGLLDNYPNPFNPSTTLSFSLQNNADVKLTIVDVTGRIVENLLSGRFAAGRYSVVWNAGLQASGSYIARLESGSRIWTKKIMLVK
jgi:glucose/arabinose dehydrogenase